MDILTTLVMDLLGGKTVGSIVAKQNDKNTRKVKILLHQGYTPWPIPEGTAAVIRYRKPDGTRGLYDQLPNGDPAVILEAGTNALTLILAPQVLTAAGKVCMDVVLINGDAELATFDILVNVLPAPVTDGDLESQDYYNYSTLAQINGAIGDLNALKTTAKENLVAAINEAAQTGGSGGASILVVTIDEWIDDNTATASHTAGEILAALQAGRSAVLRETVEDDVYEYQLDCCYGSDTAVFKGAYCYEDGEVQFFRTWDMTVDAAGTVTFSENEELSTDTVHYKTSQDLTDEEKNRVCGNIGAQRARDILVGSGLSAMSAQGAAMLTDWQETPILETGKTYAVYVEGSLLYEAVCVDTDFAGSTYQMLYYPGYDSGWGYVPSIFQSYQEGLGYKLWAWTNNGVPWSEEGLSVSVYETGQVFSINGRNGNVELDAAAVGAIPTPASAAVGQTIVVKEVDEEGKPIAWTAADLPIGGGAGLWEHICDITTTEAVDGGITISENSEGVSLSDLQYNEIWVIAKMVGVSTNTNNWWACTCGIHQQGSTNQAQDWANGASSGGTNATRYVSWYTFIRGGKVYWTDCATIDPYDMAGGNQAWLNNMLNYYNFDYFTDVRINSDSSRIIDVGTEIRILGRRA